MKSLTWNWLSRRSYRKMSILGLLGARLGRGGYIGQVPWLGSRGLKVGRGGPRLRLVALSFLSLSLLTEEARRRTPRRKEGEEAPWPWETRAWQNQKAIGKIHAFWTLMGERRRKAVRMPNCLNPGVPLATEDRINNGCSPWWDWKGITIINNAFALMKDRGKQWGTVLALKGGSST